MLFNIKYFNLRETAIYLLDWLFVQEKQIE